MKVRRITAHGTILAAVTIAEVFAWFPACAALPNGAVTVNPLREAYYGDLHLHTSYSFDAYLQGTTRIDPDAAYRFAEGQEVQYLGQTVRRREPLDFLAVTDHSENLGVFTQLEDPHSAISKSAQGQTLREIVDLITGPDGRHDFARLENEPPSVSLALIGLIRDCFAGVRNKLAPELRPESAAAWVREVEFANRHYRPGQFTTFIAYEWTATPFGANLHRNVIFKGDRAPNPFTAFDSVMPENLWAWLEAIRGQGFEALAIPHNPNASNGLMYDWIGSNSGVPMDRAYAEERQANEPLSEIAQNKGASETHPLLSPNDEFANYEIFDYLANDRRHEGRFEGSYLRDALSRGLAIQRASGANPYKYGFVGGSDLHSGLSVSAQADYGGNNTVLNIGGGKLTHEQASKLFQSASRGDGSLKTTAGNLTGVWAQSNTRESIYAALRRRETFATSGTRLKFRFFGGWNFDRRLLQHKDWIARAYAQGVPMGGDLPVNSAGAGAPTFAIWAVKDPNGANLDRVQVIKVWEESGQQKEKVFDVAWAGDRHPDPKTAKLPSVGDTVDLKSGGYANTIGAAELKTVWTDPQFDPNDFAAYYLRVLEIPTPHWLTLLAVKHGLPLPIDAPATMQQRGWSSPIWVNAQHAGAGGG